MAGVQVGDPSALPYLSDHCIVLPEPLDHHYLDIIQLMVVGTEVKLLKISRRIIRFFTHFLLAILGVLANTLNCTFPLKWDFKHIFVIFIRYW